MTIVRETTPCEPVSISTQAPTSAARQELPVHTSLRTDFSWTLVGNAVYAGGQWLALMLLAKLTKPELVGQYALGIAFAVPVFMLTSFQLRLALASDIKQQTHFGHYLSFRLLSTALGLVIIALVTQIMGFRGQLRWVVLLVGLVQAIDAISDIYYGRLQLHNRMVSIAKSMMARTVISAVGFTVAVCFNGNLAWGLWAVVVARVIVLFGYDIRTSTHNVVAEPKSSFQNERLRPHWNLRVQRQLLWFAFPIGIATVLASLNSAIPRYFIEHALGEHALGIFSAIAFMFSAGSMAVVSLGQSAFTRLARSYAEENLIEFRSRLLSLLTLGAGLGVYGIVVAKVAGPEILTLLFRPEYAQHANLLVWIMAAGCVGYMAQCLGVGMCAAGYYRSQIVLFIVTNLTVLGASWILIPRQGLLGAVFAILISGIVQLAGSVMILAMGMRKLTCVWARNAEAT